MKQRHSFHFFLAFLASLSILAGCASQYEPSGFFASYGLLEPGPYFKQEFVEPLAHFEKYKKIQLRPVLFDYLDKECEYKLGPGEKERLEASFNASLRKALSKKFQLAGEDAAADQETLIVEPALVYARKPARLINTISSLLIMVPLTSGSAAFEVKLMDASTGKVVAEVAEKRTGAGDLKSILIGPFMKFEHLEAIFDKWSENLTLFISSQKYMPVTIHG